MGRAFIDRGRAGRLMQGRGIDALVVVQPENFRYVTGAHPSFPSFWRRAGTQLAVVPAAADETCAAIVTDAAEPGFRAMSNIADVRTHPIWIDSLDVRPFMSEHQDTSELLRAAAQGAGRYVGGSRPPTYDLSLALAKLRDVLNERGLDRGRLGVEFDFMPVSDLQAFQAFLPQVHWVDSSDVFRWLRLVKHADEIALLRRAAALAETGIERVCEQVAPGLTANDLSLIFRGALIEEARTRGIREFESSWTAYCCGPEVNGAGSSTAPLEKGHVVKLDCGATLAGCISDVARTFVLGRGTKHARAIYQAIHEAWEIGVELFRPGVPLRRVHEAAQAHMRKVGYSAYTRGHVGHGIGSTIWNEEWPYISETDETVIEPDMCFAFEVPVYADGIGAFTIEENIVVTQNGYESLNRLSRDYRELD